MYDLAPNISPPPTAADAMSGAMHPDSIDAAPTAAKIRTFMKVLPLIRQIPVERKATGE